MQFVLQPGSTVVSTSWVRKSATKILSVFPYISSSDVDTGNTYIQPEFVSSIFDTKTNQMLCIGLADSICMQDVMI